MKESEYHARKNIRKLEAQAEDEFREWLVRFIVNATILITMIGVGVGITALLMMANPFMIFVGLMVAVPLVIGTAQYISER